jgi:cation diffusion facilitator family transporter
LYQNGPAIIQPGERVRRAAVFNFFLNLWSAVEIFWVKFLKLVLFLKRPGLNNLEINAGQNGTVFNVYRVQQNGDFPFHINYSERNGQFKGISVQRKVCLEKGTPFVFLVTHLIILSFSLPRGMAGMKSKTIVYIALASDVVIAVTKFVAAGITHSSAMVSEGIHSIIDAISQLLLLWGIKISKKKPDDERPFGYGRELYFWSFIVSLIIFTMGGCISFYEGMMRFKRPEIEAGQGWNYIVLLVSFLFTAISAIASLKAFNRQRGDTPFWKAVTRSKDPSVFIVLLGDMGDLICLLIAFAGIWLTHALGNPRYDGIASISIGMVLILISLLLVRESRSLLMGEPIRKATMRQIVSITESDPAVVKVQRQFSVYMAPEEIILQITAVFKDELSTEQITGSINNIIKSIQQKFPLVKQIFIEPVGKKT